jgi:hypothetical protein
MSFPFDPDEAAVVIQVRLWGPRGRTVTRLALDTGATETLVNWDIAVLLGYDPSGSSTRLEDLQDLAVVAERREEEAISLREMKRRLLE